MTVVIPWLRIVLALLFCLALAVAAILVLRRRYATGLAPRLSGWLQPVPGRAPAQPDLVARVRLSATAQMVVLEWEATRYLVHVCASGATLIDQRAVGGSTA